MGRILSIIVALAVCGACTEPIDIDLNKDENIRLFVDAEIDDQPETDTLYLTYTSNFFEETGEIPANNLSVIVSDGTQDFVFAELNATGKYLSPQGFVGVPSTQYELRINDGNETFTAQSFLNPPIPIDSLSQERLGPDDFFNADEVEIGISFQDPPGKRDYYWFIDYVNGKNEYENLFEYGALFNDEVINGRYLEDVEYGTFDLEIGDTLEIELRTIEKNTEEILIAIASESFRGGIFDSTPSNVPSNISGDALGLFVAYAKTRKEIIIQE